VTKLQGSWIWYELMTPDPVGAKAFYDAVVGWNITTGHGDDNDYGFVTCADGGMTGGLLRLTKDMTDQGARPCWLGYIGVDNVDASLTAIEAAGGKTLMAARDVPMAGRIAMVSDCCGAPIYVMTPTPPPGGGESTAFSTALLGRCSWNELMAGNSTNALAFYTGLFGWDLPEPMDMGPMGTYHFINHDGGGIGAVMQAPPGAPTGWAHYFRVASIGAAAKAIAANGGTLINGPMEGIDPQGAMFALVGAQ
jgi:uncharacterized protein